MTKLFFYFNIVVVENRGDENARSDIIFLHFGKRTLLLFSKLSEISFVRSSSFETSNKMFHFRVLLLSLLISYLGWGKGRHVFFLDRLRALQRAGNPFYFIKNLYGKNSSHVLFVPISRTFTCESF